MEKYAITYFVVEDLEELTDCSREYITEWLEEHEEDLQEAMIKAGYDYIMNFLPEIVRI